jgi:hypothetical protein
MIIFFNRVICRHDNSAGISTRKIASDSSRDYSPNLEQKKLGDLIAMQKDHAKVFIAYEDSDSFSAISKFGVFPEVMPRTPTREEMETVNFSGFWEELSWGKAVTAATGADIIIVSLSGRMDLPVPVQRWMEGWPNHEEASHTTLVVVFGTEQRDSSKHHVLISYFQQMAENHGMDFLCHCDGAKNFPVHPRSSERAPQVEMPGAERYQAFDLPQAA